MRPDLTYLDRITALERAEARKSRSGDPSGDGGSDGSDNDEGGDDTAVQEKKRKAAAAKSKAAAADAKALNVSFKTDGDSKSGGMGHLTGVATGRQDGSLFAPWRFEESEAWQDLKHFAPNVGFSSLVA